MSSINKILNLFKLDEERQKKVLEQVSESSKPDLDYYVLTIFAGMIITLGLILDNNAVVIGGMLMAPLVWPILALGLAMNRGSLRLFQRSVVTIIKSSMVILLAAVIMGWLSPFQEFGNEVLSRTTPTILELFIAIMAGFIAAFVISYPGLNNFISGVVIAAAVVPPLCVTGLSIATKDLGAAAGSLLLFTSNLIAMILSAMFFFFLASFKPLTSESSLERRKSNLTWTVIFLIIIIIPLLIITGDVIKDSQNTNIVRNTILSQVEDSEISQIQITDKEGVLFIQASIRSVRNLTPLQMEALTGAMSEALGTSINLRVTIIPILEAGKIYTDDSVPASTTESSLNNFKSSIFPEMKNEKE